jgi:hypothetical protein
MKNFTSVFKNERVLCHGDGKQILDLLSSQPNKRNETHKTCVQRFIMYYIQHFNQVQPGSCMSMTCTTAAIVMMRNQF